MINKNDIANFERSFIPMSLTNCNNYQSANGIYKIDIRYYNIVERLTTGNGDIVLFDGDLVIQLPDLSYIVNLISKHDGYIDDKPYIDCINENILQPMLLMVNDIFIPWENIYIYYNINEYHLVIKDTVITVDKLEIYGLPTPIIYEKTIVEEEIISNELELLFSFDGDGNLINDKTIESMYRIFLNNTNKRYIVQNVRCNPLYPITYKIADNHTYILPYINYQYNLTPSSILLIKNGIISNENNIEVYSSNIFRLTDDPTFVDGELNSGYIIVFDTYNDNNINNITNYPYIDDEELYRSFMNSDNLLNLKYDNHIDLKMYNEELYDKLYLSDKDLNIKRISMYTDIPINSIPKGLDDYGNENGLIIFNNGKQIQYNISVNGTIILSEPIIGNIDILQMRNIHNVLYDGTLPSEGLSKDIAEVFTTENIKTNVSTENVDSKYTYPHDTRIEITEDVAQLTVIDNKVNMTTSDPNSTLYDASCTYTVRNQFRSKYITVDEDFIDKGYTVLDGFETCNDTNKYIVFHNGYLLPIETYTLTLLDFNKPYYEQRVYINFNVNIGDTISIIYLPYELKEFVATNDTIIIDNDGYLPLDISTLDFPVFSNTILVFIGGVLIPLSNIISINKNKLLIKYSDFESSLHIIFLILDYDEDLLEFIKSNDSVNCFAANELLRTPSTDPEYDTLFHQYYKVKPDIKAMKNEYVLDNLDSTWLSITRDFYNARTTNIKHQGFDNTVDGYEYIKYDNSPDSDNTEMLKTYDATDENNYDIYARGQELVWTTLPALLNNANNTNNCVGTFNDTVAVRQFRYMNTERFNGEVWSVQQAIQLADDASGMQGTCGVPDNLINIINSETVHFNGSIWSRSYATTNVPRYNNTLCGTYNSAVLMGGSEDATGVDTIEVLTDTTWNILGDSINKLYNSSMVGTIKEFTTIGGSTDKDNVSNISTNMVYKRDILSVSPHMCNVPRSLCAANGSNDNIIVFGGTYDVSGRVYTTDITEVYDGNTWSVLNINNTPRYGLGSCDVGLQSMIVGGTNMINIFTPTSEKLERI